MGRRSIAVSSFAHHTGGRPPRGACKGADSRSGRAYPRCLPPDFPLSSFANYSCPVLKTTRQREIRRVARRRFASAPPGLEGRGASAAAGLAEASKPRNRGRIEKERNNADGDDAVFVGPRGGVAALDKDVAEKVAEV